MSVVTFGIRMALSAVLIVPTTQSTAADAFPPPLTSLKPVIVFVGGSSSERQTVSAAVDRFLETGLALPDLVIRLHDDNAGCGGKQGLFRAEGPRAVIDLCFEREFLALHELGHAWEHFNLGDRDRARFQRFIESPTWRSRSVVHNRRAIEIAADSMAHGLLTAPLGAGNDRKREFARFQVLTGKLSPRLREGPAGFRMATERFGSRLSSTGSVRI